MTAQIVTLQEFHRYATPRDLIPLINQYHRGALMLVHMCRHFPRNYTRNELMEIGNFRRSDLGTVCAVASFHWWILRINDRLPRTGWRIDDANNYRLEPITADHARLLERRLNMVAA